jgi:hypothetical protein
MGNRSIIVLAVCLMSLLHHNATAASLRISWNANTESDLDGYIVYLGAKSNMYDQAIDVGNVTTYRVDGLGSGIWKYIALSSYDTSGNESARSSELSIYFPAEVPSIRLISPISGATCSSSPTLTWSGSGIKNYRAYISVSYGLIYRQVYSGTSTYTTLDPLLIWLFILPGTKVYWYVEGTTTTGGTVSSKVYTLIKGL